MNHEMSFEKALCDAFLREKANRDRAMAQLDEAKTENVFAMGHLAEECANLHAGLLAIDWLLSLKVGSEVHALDAMLSAIEMWPRSAPVILRVRREYREEVSK